MQKHHHASEPQRSSRLAHSCQKRERRAKSIRLIGFNQRRLRIQTRLLPARSKTKGSPKCSASLRSAIRPPTACRSAFSMTSREIGGFFSIDALNVTPSSFFSKTPQINAREL